MSDLRETLRETMHEAAEAETVAPDAGPVGHDDSPVAAADLVSGSGDVSAGSADRAVQDSTKPETATARARDATGKFAKAAAKAAEKTLTPAPAPAVTTQTPPPRQADTVASPAPIPVPGETSTALKAPQSWKPAAREAWSKVPADVQQEIDRREREMQRKLTETDEQRKGYDGFRQAAAPFEQHIRANGGEVLPTVQGLLQTQYQLATGTPQTKAALVAQVIKAYGVGIEELASALDGQPQAQQGQGQQSFRDPRFDQFIGGLEAERDRRAQSRRAEMTQELSAFAAKNEFYEDVKERMAALLGNKQASTLDEAYDAAVWSRTDLRAILQQREAAKAATSSNGATQRARAAAISVKSEPSTDAPEPPADSIRGALRQSMAEVKQRRQ